MNSNLLKEAIADADAIKKLAIENAKASLNEAFDSKIKSMLAARLNEEADDEMEEGDEDTMEEARRKKAPVEDDEDDIEDEAPRETKKAPIEDDEEEDETDEAYDIDEILAEMEDYDKMEENEEDDTMDEGSYEEQDENYDEMDEEVNWYRRKKGLDEAEEDGEDGEDDEKHVDEELDLEALIREMEGDDDKLHEEDETDEEEENKYKAPKGKGKNAEMEEMKEELYENRRQVKKLIQKVQESNLINAKLLYLNKVLRNHNLNEQQKIKVITAFDRATTAKEAKIVFESLNEAFSVKIERRKNGLKESFGFASKAAGTSTKREIITEVDSQVSRWQKLAGINRYL